MNSCRVFEDKEGCQGSFCIGLLSHTQTHTHTRRNSDYSNNEGVGWHLPSREKRWSPALWRSDPGSMSSCPAVGCCRRCRRLVPHHQGPVGGAAYIVLVPPVKLLLKLLQPPNAALLPHAQHLPAARPASERAGGGWAPQRSGRAGQWRRGASGSADTPRPAACARICICSQNPSNNMSLCGGGAGAARA